MLVFHVGDNVVDVLFFERGLFLLTCAMCCTTYCCVFGRLICACCSFVCDISNVHFERDVFLRCGGEGVAHGQRTNTEHRTPNTKHRTPNIEHRTSNTKHQTPSIKYRTPNTTYQTLPNTKHQTSNTRHQTPNTAHQTPSTQRTCRGGRAHGTNGTNRSKIRGPGPGNRRP